MFIAYFVRRADVCRYVEEFQFARNIRISICQFLGDPTQVLPLYILYISSVGTDLLLVELLQDLVHIADGDRLRAEHVHLHRHPVADLRATTTVHSLKSLISPYIHRHKPPRYKETGHAAGGELIAVRKV